MTRRTRWPARVFIVLSLSAACATWRWEPAGPRRIAPVAEAELVGDEECLVCHDEIQGHEKIATYHAGCEGCHGAGSLHNESEAPEDIRFPGNDDCLGCHGPGYASHLQWGTGEHARAGVFCTDCHNPHAVSKQHLRDFAQTALPHMDLPSRLCVECHREVGSQLQFPSHHPVPEGAMGCLSCHDPHEDARVSLGDQNQRCAGCHQDVVGPWTFEHPPVVEDCGLCHDPHGAVTDSLLGTIQPAVCLSCHSLNDFWHHNFSGTGIFTNTTISSDRPTAPGQVVTAQEARTFLRRCTDCHGAVHGSYTDEHLRH